MRSLRGADLTHAEYRVLVNLCTYADAVSGEAYPSNETLAKAASVDTRGMTRTLIPSLLEKGWIRLVAPGGNQNGKGRANVWKLSSPDTAKGGTDYPPSNQPRAVPTTTLPSETRGVLSTDKGGTEYHEGGYSLPPHQVIDQPMNRSESFSHLSNASASNSAVTEKPKDDLPVEVTNAGRSAPTASASQCQLCNGTGYFGTVVCDHNPDRINTARRGKALVDAALAAKRKAG
ncbi:helix-turn-helix domain-containing protein [Rhodococcus sp. NPDC060176]|uniref:helix-turn-helix domain-containing protein n=1 Tax=Rhodococcus sp. NPDC060176 TaxID=3347062 RepID=UPI0036468632